MGCGSSRSAIAVVEETGKPTEKTKSTSLDHFVVESSKKETAPENINNTSSNIRTENIINRSSCGSLNSINNAKNINTSVKSLREDSKREKSASSVKSKDSGVCDENFERKDSAKSQTSVTSKPPSAGKRSSARKKILRIDDNTIREESNEVSKDTGVSMISRPKSRFGNVAFDLVLDTPETGNMKKRPEKLALIQQKRRKSTKKIKTKEEIDRKIQEADERRKIQETEKQMKAKQFQHLSIHTTVQPFQAPSEEEDDQVDKNNNNNNSMNTKESYNNDSNSNGLES